MALRSVQKLQEERRLLQERLGSLQRALAQLEAEKREVERSAMQLDKDRVALRKTLDKVEREKLQSREDTLRLSAEKGRLDCTLTGAELDLAKAQQQIQHLEVIPAPPLAWSPVPCPCRAQEVLGVGSCL